MDEPDVASPPVPRQSDASPLAWKAGCTFACGLMLLLVLYVGSFALLIVDIERGLGFWARLDDRTAGFLLAFYLPLFWIYENVAYA